MAAGYNSKSVTKDSSGVSWSFNATAITSSYAHVKVECGDFTAEAHEINTTASVAVSGSAAVGTEDYNAGSKTYTIKQYVKATYEGEWVEDGTATCTVSWDVAVLRAVVNGTVTVCSNIKVKSGSTVKDVIGVYSVKDGVVKPGI